MLLLHLISIFQYLEMKLKQPYAKIPTPFQIIEKYNIRQKLKVNRTNEIHFDSFKIKTLFATTSFKNPFQKNISNKGGSWLIVLSLQICTS